MKEEPSLSAFSLIIVKFCGEYGEACECETNGIRERELDANAPYVPTKIRGMPTIPNRQRYVSLFLRTLDLSENGTQTHTPVDAMLDQNVILGNMSSKLMCKILPTGKLHHTITSSFDLKDARCDVRWRSDA